MGRMSSLRHDGRSPTSCARHVRARLHRVAPRGSVLVAFGRTRVLCTASVDERVPPWMRGTGKGWVTAEYSMLPGSTPERVDREAAQGQAVGPHPGDPAPDRPVAARGHRPGRCCGERADHRRLRRAAGRRRHAHRVDLRRLRRAARRVHPPGRRRRRSRRTRSTEPCAAISVGVVDARRRCSTSSTPRTSRAEVDMNVVMTGDGPLRRGAGHGRGRCRSRRGELDDLLGLAEHGIAEILDAAGARCSPSRRRRAAP